MNKSRSLIQRQFLQAREKRIPNILRDVPVAVKLRQLGGFRGIHSRGIQDIHPDLLRAERYPYPNPRQHIMMGGVGGMKRIPNLLSDY